MSNLTTSQKFNEFFHERFKHLLPFYGGDEKKMQEHIDSGEVKVSFNEISNLLEEFLFSEPSHLQINYTEKDMVSFGFYLLSEERKNKFIDHKEEPNGISIEERLAMVWDADLSNWKEKNF